MPVSELNENARRRCDEALEGVAALNVAIHEIAEARVIDCGVEVQGGLEAGRLLAEICMAGLGRVAIVPPRSDFSPGAAVSVRTDQPCRACLAAQYAGWRISGDGYFAMGSGPMRAAAGKEPLIDALGLAEKPACAVGVLESAGLPPPEVCRRIAADCSVRPDQLTLLVAPTASLAGTVQVVARTVETALHKLHELGFELRRIVSGFGVAPLPPIAADDLVGIGRTNDAVLYGGEVTLWVTGDDDSLREIGPRTPSSASGDHGRPFAEVFAAYDHDFYRVDPLLFSPAVVSFVNLDSGSEFCFGELRPDVLKKSFRG